MKASRIIILLVTAIFSITTAVETPSASQKAIDPTPIKDKVSVTLGQELRITFAKNGDRFLTPKGAKRAKDDKGAVDVKLHVTDSTPFPVRGTPTRPFLAVSNGFEKTLKCRALARLKGSKEFFPVRREIEPIAPGDQATLCWESGSQVEEVVLYEFTLIPKSK